MEAEQTRGEEERGREGIEWKRMGWDGMGRVLKERDLVEGSFKGLWEHLDVQRGNGVVYPELIQS